jgi:hypothetical protein
MADITTSVERLTWESSLDKARERARKETKPILIDFSAAPQ